jgi:hypothetical protein
MFFNSKKWALVIASNLLTFSDPARSHKFIFDLNKVPLWSTLFVSIIN